MGSFSTARPLPTPCGKGRPVHFRGLAPPRRVLAVSSTTSPSVTSGHSTVTDLARLRGLSTSVPRRTATCSSSSSAKEIIATGT